MQRNQNQMIKKNTRLKWTVLLLSLIILILVGAFFLNILGNTPSSSDQNGGVNTSSTDRSSDSSIDTTDSSTSVKNEQQTNETSYSVTFNGYPEASGTYGTLKFHMVTGKSNDGIELTYNSPNFQQTQSALLVPITIPTKSLKVNEHSSVKIVKVNTELKLDTVADAATKDFFYPFNENDTRVYAYYMNNGHIALAFQPHSNVDQYQVIEFDPSLTSNTTDAPTYEEAKKIMQEKYQTDDSVYADLGSSSDRNGAYRKIKATSVSMKEDGGSGTLGFLKVYSDGIVVETSDGNFEHSNENHPNVN
ncbi:hypothetical protein [uncultured Enterococcus sp.]|nr:hypothetical protein [uncultured Enterococcus sp.]